MTGTVMLVVLFAAALHASWNALVKSGSDKFMDAVLIAAGSALLGLVLLPFLPVPDPASWPFAAASGLLQVVYFGLLSAAYRTGDMSVVYPLMRGAAPLLVAAAAVFLLDEHPGPGGWAGIALISCGVLGLALTAGRRGAGPAPVLFALANAAVIASYTTVDGIGARLSGNVASYTFWILGLPAVPLLLWAAWRRARDLRAQFLQRWHLALLGGACSLGAYALALWAMTQAPIALVAALRETSILFGVALAGLVLKERLGWTRIAAAGTVALGVVALRLA